MKHGLMICISLACLLCATTVAASEPQEREIVKIGEDITITWGERVTEAAAIGGDVTVEGEVAHDVVAVGGTVFLGPYARIGGDVTSIGGTIVQQDGASVHGKISVIQTPDLSRLTTLLSRCHLPEITPLFFQFSSLGSFIGFFLLGLLIVALMPSTVGQIAFMLEHHLLQSMFWGILGLVLIVPIGVVLLISIVGIVLIPLEIIGVACGLLLGSIAAAQLAGKKILRSLTQSDQSIMWETVFGLLIFFAISWVPFLGWLVIALLTFLGFGGLLAHLTRRSRATAETEAER